MANKGQKEAMHIKDVTPEEAQEALATIQQTTIKTQRTLASWAYYQIIWGIAWAFGFLTSQFVQPRMLIWIWVPLLVLGTVVSMIVGIYQRKRGRTVRTIHGVRLSWFFATLFCYVLVWFAIVPALGTLQLALFLVTVVMFGYVVVGIWLRSPLLIGSCIVVTLLALLGYYLLPGYFWAWETLFGGGTLIGSGLYLLLRRR